MSEAYAVSNVDISMSGRDKMLDQRRGYKYCDVGRK